MPPTPATPSALARLLQRKPVVWTLLVLPGLWPAWPIFVTRNPSVLADPLKFILHHLGFVACVVLVTVLTFTPLRVLFPHAPLVQALNRHRRLVGVAAAAYAALHFATHLLYEGGTDVAFLPAILATAVEKPFQLTGLIAFVILLVLAVTSPHAILRRLGARRWKFIHRFVYLAAALVAYHQISARKVFPVQVLWIFVPLLALELARIVTSLRRSAGSSR
ncbi:ferric reductase-like transmembrane domain-containing protein [Opitutus sp. ER46]|uniref:sulfite oxidase heme-binding subunit YedZ n=1 Tax=Opitutus sp. ER46 TaxID=2161864 RepID=UPI001304E35F|nr:ferric reductase-like transmembrane domain-containing protein [Opitutus sp. ER46]